MGGKNTGKMGWGKTLTSQQVKKIKLLIVIYLREYLRHRPGQMP
jgi:hypothetical protein